eukprot:scaffold5918_cov124-Isochrysis_galbana.AAC.17
MIACRFGAEQVESLSSNTSSDALSPSKRSRKLGEYAFTRGRRCGEVVRTSGAAGGLGFCPVAARRLSSLATTRTSAYIQGHSASSHLRGSVAVAIRVRALESDGSPSAETKLHCSSCCRAALMS